MVKDIQVAKGDSTFLVPIKERLFPLQHKSSGFPETQFLECRSPLLKVYHTIPLQDDRKSRPVVQSASIYRPESNGNTGR